MSYEELKYVSLRLHNWLDAGFVNAFVRAYDHKGERAADMAMLSNHRFWAVVLRSEETMALEQMIAEQQIQPLGRIKKFQDRYAYADMYGRQPNQSVKTRNVKT